MHTGNCSFYMNGFRLLCFAWWNYSWKFFKKNETELTHSQGSQWGKYWHQQWQSGRWCWSSSPEAASCMISFSPIPLTCTSQSPSHPTDPHFQCHAHHHFGSHVFLDPFPCCLFLFEIFGNLVLHLLSKSICTQNPQNPNHNWEIQMANSKLN